MRFGTYYFFQAAPGRRHAQVIHDELEQMVVRHMQTMRDLGVGQVLCWMSFGGLPQDRVRRSMELFAREVMPHFH